MDIVVATNNKGKLAEIRRMLPQYNVLSQREVGADIDVEETGTTYEENAALKARGVRPYTDRLIIADDSGLEVDVLSGAPGLYSARYAGEGTTPDDGMKKLLKNLNGVQFEKRGAQFVCCMVLLDNSGEVHSFRGECRGYILNEKRGDKGFGFDPVFWVDEYDKTFAELDGDIKNKISHRHKALEKLACYLNENYDK